MPCCRENSIGGRAIERALVGFQAFAIVSNLKPLLPTEKRVILYFISVEQENPQMEKKIEIFIGSDASASFKYFNQIYFCYLNNEITNIWGYTQL